MKPRNLFVLATAVSALALPQLSVAACSHNTKITNTSKVTMHVIELKSAVVPPLFKSQWTGDRTIAPGASSTIGWTSDFSCTDNGAPNVFDVKLIRKDGNTHYCGGLVQSQGVKVDTPDLCFLN